ncbi:COX15/CtaA family protein [Lacibacterium aquatile]|uniref:Heme A synthase n=1 Tax=Lacibacterium aquatile TaxID=1168082 RepID=A0ABW5DRS4_9PROT
MVVIGGITRLTESGLSITEWKPLGGAIPPLNAADWEEQFRLYRESPQYIHVNAGMSLEEFKGIFWWEWIHRFWGRLIGFVFLIPLLAFWIRGKLSRGLAAPLFGLFVLGGLQGALGWYMVVSGLNDVPWVSPYRLAAHLGLALVLYVACFWLGVRLWGTQRVTVQLKLKIGSHSVLALIFVTILAGAFVAGLDAGMIYNEFPKMGDGLVPPDYRNPALSWFSNIFENHAAVQFHHRVLATLTVLGVVAFALRIWRVPALRGGAICLLAAVALQYCLGIMTLLAQVPVSLGATHQGGAVVLLTAALWVATRLKR